MFADALVEFENGDHGRRRAVLAPGCDLDAGDQRGTDAGVAAFEGEHGCQSERFDAGLSAEMVADTAPEQCGPQWPAVGDVVQQGLKAVVDQERGGQFGEASARVARPVNELGTQISQDRDAVVAYDVFSVLGAEWCAGQRWGSGLIG